MKRGPGLRVGGIVLCGGKSSRMGLPKADLPFGNETMLERVLRVLIGVVDPLVVVAAADQTLPNLPPSVIVARDRREGQGPLEGLLVGLNALTPHCEAAYATGCDVPLLAPEFVQAMIDWLGEYDAAVPVDGEFHHPLAAVYRTRVTSAIETLISENQLRPFFLFERVATNPVAVDLLRAADPELQSLVNLNHPRDYLAALRTAGHEVDAAIAGRLAPKNA